MTESTGTQEKLTRLWKSLHAGYVCVMDDWLIGVMIAGGPPRDVEAGRGRVDTWGSLRVNMRVMRERCNVCRYRAAARRDKILMGCEEGRPRDCLR